MTNQEWKNWQEVTQIEADQLNDMYDAIIRLQERVRALERAQEIPDTTFWAQLVFDAAALFGFVWIVVILFGG